MDSMTDSPDSSPSPKRRKAGRRDDRTGFLREEASPAGRLACAEPQLDGQEATSADCDSGYDASTLESAPTPNHMASLDMMPDSSDSDDDSVGDDEDRASTISHLSNISGLSGLSGQDWKSMGSSLLWIQKKMASGVDPRSLLSDNSIPEHVDDVTLWKIIINVLTEPPQRRKLRHVNTLDDVIRLLKNSKKVVVLTGAGVSVSCGIPDFRSRDGIYARLAKDFPDLPDPQAMFDISYFSKDPRPFFKFARDIYPGKFKPSPCHRFIKLLESKNKLLRNYTQNIDTLEREAGIERLVECHGSFASATCTKCCYRTCSDSIREDVLEQRIPFCPRCWNADGEISAPNFNELVARGIMKPDIVFFGEGLPDTFHESMTRDKDECDLLIVIGSSLKVRPVALIPSSLPAEVPQILINREPLPHYNFDVELLGDCDVIIDHICKILGESWTELCWRPRPLVEAKTLLPPAEPAIPEEMDLATSSCSNNGDDARHVPDQDDDEDDDVESQLRHLRHDQEDDDNNDEEDVNNDDNESCKPFKPAELPAKPQQQPMMLMKERHISTDSTRDSGIGNETPHCSDVNANTEEEEEEEEAGDGSEAGDGPGGAVATEAYWEKKLKASLASRLPEDGFYFVPPSRYIFPGAEVFDTDLDLDRMSSCNEYFDSEETSSSSRSGLGSENGDF